ncbi:hypothetical protein [Roseovarius sp. A-2]|uniref:hypothetical protein n=1 Tax=Roseovarius sp. A-2 TaxID=1570360 RepID=UPI0020CAA697|nr:hypothetical protein [Roseovarius sp. A-2]
MVAPPLPRNHYHTVIDFVGVAGFAALIDALRPGGHYAGVGVIAGPMFHADLCRIYLRDIARAQVEFQTKTHNGKLFLLPREADTWQKSPSSTAPSGRSWCAGPATGRRRSGPLR